MERLERWRNYEGALIAALKGLQADLWTAMPGILKNASGYPAFDPVKMTATVQPAITGNFRQKDGTFKEVTMPLCVDVPVIFPSGGGFTLTFPLKDGDEGLLFFASRCIDGWWQNGGVQAQIELRMHDLSDGFVMVGPRSQPRVLNPSVDPDNVVLRSDDNQALIRIKPNHDIEAETVGNINMTASGHVFITAGGQVKIIGSRIDLNP